MRMSDQTPARPTRRLSGDGGFSLFVVMMVLVACTMFVAVGYAAAQGDLPLSGDSKDRKQTFAAAEAGVAFYQFHLNQDNDYWLKCTDVQPPNATEVSPVNQEFHGGATDPRSWRNVPDSPAQYTIELLPAPASGYTQCVKAEGKSMLDPVSNVFRIRVTGRPFATSPLRRSIIATFRRTGFLDFIYYTNYETLDPAAYASASARASAEANCANRPRAQRTSSACTEIVFAGHDSVNGPLHSNDTLLMCGSPVFGRTPKDRVSVFGPAPGWVKSGSAGCSPASPQFKSPLKLATKGVDMPPSNDELRKMADAEYIYTGKTTIEFTGSATTMKVVNKVKFGDLLQHDVALPPNGVVYVQNNVAGVCNPSVPSAYNYTTESAACGNLWVKGNYTTSMTLAAANDVVLNGDLLHQNDQAVMGLVANNFVRVYHPVENVNCGSSTGANGPGALSSVTIDAAILTLQHSFIVDNYRCGAQLGNLNVNGAIAQKYRGPVGTTGGTGYTKSYWYDDRLKYRTPPYFLQPTSSAWNVVRFNEQIQDKPKGL
jgi:hypothetical protein